MTSKSESVVGVSVCDKEVQLQLLKPYASKHSSQHVEGITTIAQKPSTILILLQDGR